MNSELLSVRPPSSNSDPMAIVSAIIEEGVDRARRMGRAKSYFISEKLTGNITSPPLAGNTVIVVGAKGSKSVYANDATTLALNRGASGQAALRFARPSNRTVTGLIVLPA